MAATSDLGESAYNGLQTKLEQQFSNGLTFLAAYTWSKTMSDAGDLLNGGSTGGYRAPSCQASVPDLIGLWPTSTFATYSTSVAVTSFHSVRTSGTWQRREGRRMRPRRVGCKLDRNASRWPAAYLRLPNRNNLWNKLQRCQCCRTEPETWPAHRLEQESRIGLATRRPSISPVYWEPPVRSRIPKWMHSLDRLRSSWRQACDNSRAGLPSVRLLDVQRLPAQRAVLDAVPGRVLQHPQPPELQRSKLRWQRRRRIRNSGNFTSSNFGEIGSTRDAPYDPRQIQFALKLYY